VGYKRKPVYEFEDENSVGLHNIPDGSKVIVKNYKGKPKEFTKRDSTGLISSTDTVKDVVGSSTTPTGETELTELSKEMVEAAHPFNGYTGDKVDMRFETSEDNILKVANMQEQYIVDGKVVGTFGPELVIGDDSTMASDTGFWLGNAWNIDGTVMNITGTASACAYFSTGLKIGANYILEFEVVSRTQGVFRWDSGEEIVSDITAIGKHSITFIAGSNGLYLNSYNDGVGSVLRGSVKNISVREVSTIDLNTTNDRTGFNGEGDNSFVPHVHVVGFDPISTGSITGTDVAADAQIGSILDNIPAQTANTRIKCRVKPTTAGIKVEILDKSANDAVVRTQAVDGTAAETLTFTLPVNDDGYKVKAAKITNDGSGDEDIQVTAEVSTGLTVDGKMKRGDYVVVDREELVDLTDLSYGYTTPSVVVDGNRVDITSDGDTDCITYFNTEVLVGEKYLVSFNLISEDSLYMWIRFGGVSFWAGEQHNPTIGRYSMVITALTSSPLGIKFYNGTATFDNISVTLADDTFKAIKNTADMYDYDSNNTNANLLQRESTVLNLEDNHYYLWIATSENGKDLSTTNYGATSYWLDLGTASTMSLTNPYFKPVDYISNQVFVGMKDDGSYIYDVLMNDAYAKDSTTKILTNNGYSSLGGGLFSKNNDVITPMGYIQL